MFKNRSILHPTDFSESSARALQYAIDLARDYGATLALLHVWQEPAAIFSTAEPIAGLDPAELRAEAKARLDAVPTPDGVVVERHFVEGEPAKEIERFANDRTTDLIVMSTHGRSGISRLVIGSVAEQVLRHAPCPVLTIKA